MNLESINLNVAVNKSGLTYIKSNVKRLLTVIVDRTALHYDISEEDYSEVMWTVANELCTGCNYTYEPQPHMISEDRVVVDLVIPTE